MRADVGAALPKWKWEILLQENLTRLRAIAGADAAALLEDIDHAGGAEAGRCYRRKRRVPREGFRLLCLKTQIRMCSSRTS
jgi:hypothetical protein